MYAKVLLANNIITDPGKSLNTDIVIPYIL